MEDLKDFLWTYVCFALGVAFCVIAFFFDRPVNVILAICALACMFRVVAKAFLQEMSWKIIVFRLTVVAFIAVELSSFYGFDVLRTIFGVMTSVGGLVSFVNLLMFLSTLSGDTDLEQ